MIYFNFIAFLYKNLLLKILNKGNKLKYTFLIKKIKSLKWISIFSLK